MASLYAELFAPQRASPPPAPAPAMADIQRKIIAEARRQGVDPALALGIAQAESSFNPHATGDRGQAVGLFQLHPAAAQDVGLRPDERFDVDKNIRGGIAYLKNRLKREGQEDRGISAYNQGVGTRDGQLSNPQYVRTVRQYQQQMQPLVAREQPGLLTRVRGAVTPASAEASPRPAGGTAMSPARSTPTGGASLYHELFDTVPAAPPSPAASTPAAPVAPAAPAPGGQGLYRELFAPPPPPPPQQSLLGRALQYGNEQILQPALQYGLESLTGPIPAEYYTPKEAPPLLEQAGQMVIPTMTTAIGAGLAGVPGAMAGSYLGRQANLALGLEAKGPSVTVPGVGPVNVGDAASVVLPAVPSAVRGARAATKAAVRRLPGASTAMHEEVATRLGTTGEGLRPARPVADYYADALQHNPAIAPSRIYTTADAILREEMRLRPSLRNTELVNVATDLRDLTQRGMVPMQDLYAHQQRVGELVRQWRNRGGTGEGQVRRLYGAFHDDLEQAATRGVPGAGELRTAIAASRREHAAEEFVEFFQPGKHGITQDPQGRVSINGGRMASAWRARLRQDDVFRQSLTPAERAEVEEIITLAQRLERLRPPRGAQYGSGRGLVRAVVGSVAGGPVGTAVAVAGPEAIGWAMQTERGRAAVRWALQDGGGRITPAAMATIAAVARPKVEPEAPPVSQTGGGPGGPVGP